MSSQGTVLIVDDDLDIRSTIADALEEEGYEVAVAANGREALEKLFEGARPNVILLDMMMPGTDGRAFRMEQLKHPSIASIPIVVFTAYGVPRNTAAELGAHGFLKKPVRLDELLRCMKRFQPC